jgi:hypothetical protein
MKIFIIKSILFVLSTFFVCYISQYSIDTGLRKTGFGNYREWNDIIDSKIQSDLIIQGSSRAWVHFSPQALDSTFDVNSYNLGIDGYNFAMQYFRLKLYLAYNKKPKYIIQSLDETTFKPCDGLFQRYQFLPYLNESIIKEAVSNYNGVDLLDLNFPLVKYRNSPIPVYVGLTTFFLGSKYTNGKYKGFASKDKLWDKSFANYKEKNLAGVKAEIDTFNLKLFNDFLNYCAHDSIQVIFVYSPEYIEAQNLFKNRQEIINIYRHFSKLYNIAMMDYSGDSICLSTRYFYNSQHLNSLGVLKFNRQFTNDVKPFIRLENTTN